jgi:23S rRNA pseudouridine2605 synthase
MRINKYIADSGITSRRKAEELILQGRVFVNQKLVKTLGYRVNPEQDEVKIDGERIRIKRNVYYLLNKPKGVISTTNDEKNRRTVIDLIKSKEKIYPVGRLDYNTTGVLFITNDGNFSNLLTHPKNRVPRNYEVKLDRELDVIDKKSLLKGIFIENRRSKFENINFTDSKDRKYIEVECVEGRNHFVKKMFETLGYQVRSLNRSSFAGVKTDLPVGKFRELNTTEINKLFNKYSKKS